jgi:hypothetical protein
MTRGDLRGEEASVRNHGEEVRVRLGRTRRDSPTIFEFSRNKRMHHSPIVLKYPRPVAVVEYKPIGLFHYKAPVKDEGSITCLNICGQ